MKLDIKRSILEANNHLTSNHISINFNDKLQNQEIIELINKIKENENIILKYYSQAGFDYDIYSEGIFFNGTFNNSYNLVEGRFFTKEDFGRDEKLAVIGKDVVKYTKVENNKRYISRGIEQYEVIGVIGKEEMFSRYDDTVLYNLNSILNNKEILDRNTWWVDSSNKSKQELKECVKSKSIEIFDTVDNSPNPLKEAIKDSKTIVVNGVLIILCILLTLVRSILYWIDSISLELSIRKNYGATNDKILLEIIKRYMLISTVSLIISLIIQKGLVKYNALAGLSYEMSYISIGLSVVFIMLIGIIFICIAMYRINKIEISRLLKEI
ncbi:MAG: ABC transporter permease [Clostridium sp.]